MTADEIKAIESRLEACTACGCASSLEQTGNYLWLVTCFANNCWKGPLCSTPIEAADQWNYLMGATLQPQPVGFEQWLADNRLVHYPNYVKVGAFVLHIEQASAMWHEYSHIQLVRLKS